MYALTGYNPMGDYQPDEINQAANQRLEQALKSLENPTPRYIWPVSYTHLTLPTILLV